MWRCKHAGRPEGQHDTSEIVAGPARGEHDLPDRRPQPFSLAAGMVFTLCGVLLLAFAHSFPAVLAAAALIGFGSSIFHPEASRVARLASGGRHGFAQSLFQVGGNAGSALGPLILPAPADHPPHTRHPPR